MSKLFPKVAVILAAYNGEKWIKKQIESIFLQEDVQIDLFISLDLSNDGTNKILNSLSKINKNLYVLPYGEKFGSAARNFYRLIKDINFSKYEFAAFADQDDIWLPMKIIHSIRSLKKTNSMAFSSDVIAFWSNGKRKIIKKSYSQKLYDYIFESAGPGCTYVFSIDPFLKFQNFITNNWYYVLKIEHDWLAYAYIRNNNYKWHISNKPMMLYRQHNHNSFGANYNFKSILKRFKLVQTGWYFDQIQSICKLLKINFISKKFILFNLIQTRRNTKQVLYILFFLIFFTNKL